MSGSIRMASDQVPVSESHVASYPDISSENLLDYCTVCMRNGKFCARTTNGQFKTVLVCLVNLKYRYDKKVPALSPACIIRVCPSYLTGKRISSRWCSVVWQSLLLLHIVSTWSTIDVYRFISELSSHLLAVLLLPLKVGAQRFKIEISEKHPSTHDEPKAGAHQYSTPFIPLQFYLHHKNHRYGNHPLQKKGMNWNHQPNYP
jgi:hypothetical protein